MGEREKLQIGSAKQKKQKDPPTLLRYIAIKDKNTAVLHCGFLTKGINSFRSQRCLLDLLTGLGGLDAIEMSSCHSITSKKKC